MTELGGVGWGGWDQIGQDWIGSDHKGCGGLERFGMVGMG